MGDNIWLDDRNGMRTPMQWSASPSAGFSAAPIERFYLPLIQDDVYGPQKVSVAIEEKDPSSLLNLVKHMVAIRKQHPAFGLGRLEWAEAGSNPAILAFTLFTPQETILVLHNLGDTPQHIRVAVPAGRRFADLLSDLNVQSDPQGHLEMAISPYGYHWLKQE
jgi:maltose alpha-D-glucosyltransferase/alpha-amylase